MLIQALRKKYLVIVLSLALFLSSIAVLPYIGTEFIPTLEEGSIMIGVTMAPSISLEKATETVMKLERAIMRHREVAETVSASDVPRPAVIPIPSTMRKSIWS